MSDVTAPAGEPRSTTSGVNRRLTWLLEREAELERLGGLLASAADGVGRLLLIEGEAGVGKTSLLSAAVDAAHERGWTVLSARGGALERGFPHGVVRQLYERELRDASAARRGRLLRGAAGLASPVLELAEAPTERRDAADAALAANHGLYWLTVELSEERPLLLAVDDAHWSDAATLLFLDYLGRRVEELPVLVALALRPAEPGAPVELIESLRALPAAEALHPGLLREEAAGELIARLAGTQPAPEFSRAAHAATGGNPFLLGELVRELASEGSQPDRAAAELVRALGPPSISRSVCGRLATLWPEALKLARAVAVLDTDAELRHAAAIAALDQEQALRAADALTAARVLARGRPLRFFHPIIRNAVYCDLPEGRRRLDHARAAVILDRAGEPDRAAVHLLATEATGDPSVVQRLRSAAARALARGAPAAAVALLRRALDEPPAEEERAATLLELGRAARLAGDPQAVRYLELALDEAPEIAVRVEAARELAAALIASRDVARAAAVLEETAEGLPSEASEERFLLEAYLLTASVFNDELARHAEGRIDRLLPRVTGHTPAERVLLAGAAYRQLETVSATAAEVAELAKLAALDNLIVEEQSAASVYVPMTVAPLLFTDCVDRADELVQAMAANARRTGSPVGVAHASFARSRVELLRGNLAEAEAAARGALAALPCRLTVATEFALAYLAFPLVEQGRPEEAEVLLREYGADSGPASPTTGGVTLLLVRSVLRLEQGRADDARRDAEDAVRRDATHAGSIPGRAYRMNPPLLLNAAGESHTARRVAERDLERARAFSLPSTEGIALAVLGVVMGGELGLQRLEQAAAKLERGPRRLDSAYALVELGAALRRANRRSEAHEPLRRGMDLAHRCGARPLAERAREELLACGTRPRKLAVTGVDSLTASEKRVARMAADGMSNKEIAQSLFVTRKTVETHLRHVYSKLDIRSRDHLADRLRPSG